MRRHHCRRVRPEPPPGLTTTSATAHYHIRPPPPTTGEDAPEEGEEEEEDVPAEGYRVLVSVKDGAKGRVMQAGGLVTDHLRIHRVALYEAGKEPSPDTVFSGVDEASVYAGPSFEELDEALQVRAWRPPPALGARDCVCSLECITPYNAFTPPLPPPQNAFYEYLEERGVHDDLAVTLSDYAR